MAALILAAAWFGVAALPAQEPVTNPPPPFAKGVIEQLDPFNKRLTIRTRHGSETYGWTDRTSLFLGDQKLTVDKLQIGDRIAIRHGQDAEGRPIALRLKVYREDTPRRVPTPLPPEQ